MNLIIKDVPNTIGIPAVRFTCIEDGGSDDWVWRSNKLNNGEFDYWLIIKITYVADYEDFKHDYIASLSAVAPSEVPKEELLAARSCMGLEDDDAWKVGYWRSPANRALMLNDYGISAQIWDDQGNNRRKLYEAARQEAQAVEGLFGFYMDRPQNRIGSTGWDFIKGDLTAGIRR